MLPFRGLYRLRRYGPPEVISPPSRRRRPAQRGACRDQGVEVERPAWTNDLDALGLACSIHPGRRWRDEAIPEPERPCRRHALDLWLVVRPGAPRQRRLDFRTTEEFGSTTRQV